MARRLTLAAALVVAGVAAVVAVFLVRGGDEPPPPALSAAPAQAETGAAEAATSVARYRIAGGGGSFVGYRVRERFASIGLVDAVGRTGDVTGAVRTEGERLVAAELTADLRALRSDEGRRDDALRTRGIETARFPVARFALTEPVALARRERTARGRLTLHGRTQPVRVRLAAQRLRGGRELELVGSAPIAFERFGIEPPSVAGVVTVQDRGTLEFRLRARRAP